MMVLKPVSICSLSVGLCYVTKEKCDFVIIKEHLDTG